MANTIIRIKRSTSSNAPGSLKTGEIAYSMGVGSQGNFGSRLFFGLGDDGSGNATTIAVIGGQYFADMLDHVPGVVTANSDIIVDSNRNIDYLKIDNVEIDGNTVKATSGDLNVTAVGSITINGAYSLPKADSTSGYVLTTDGAGTLTFQPSAATLKLTGDSTAGELSLLTSNLRVFGGEGIDTTVSGNTITISGEDASDTNKGIAAFGTRDFSVTAGNVLLSNTVVATSNTTLGSTGAVDSVKSFQFTFNPQGRIVGSATWSDIPLTYTYNADTGTPVKVVTGANVTFTGGEGIDTSVAASGNTITIAAELATYDNKGVAEFNADSFTVASGNVELKTVNTNVGSYGSATNVPVVTVDGKGRVTAISTAAISTNFTIAAETGTSQTFNNGGTLTFAAGEGIDTVVTANTITISGEDASTTNKGIASFNTNNFTVASGAVSTKPITIGTTSVNSGATVSVLAGLTQLDVDNIRIDGNTISSTDSNADIIISPNGTGGISVENSRIKSLLDPIDPQDAATKIYVDEVAQGLAVKPAVRVATTSNLIATYDNGNAGVGSSLTIAPTATLNIDGVTSWAQYDGILVKNQTNAAHNGRYYVSQVGGVSTAWILVRCGYCDEAGEIPSAYVYVQEGSTYASTGWVATVENFSTFTVGTDDVNWTQFSGAGTYTAGDGLDLNGTVFSVKVAGALEIVDDNVQLRSSVAGNGLVYTSNILNVVGTTNRITVNADSIDIASTYVGQSSIITLGTITTGTWNADTISAARGGTGHTTYANYDILYGVSPNTLAKLTMGAAGTILQANATTGALEWNMLDGGTY
jgi:hypothetical protein